jgi:putative transposase
MNPVAAGLVANPGDYLWSSARAHIAGQDDRLTKIEPLLSIIPDWNEFLSLSTEEELEVLHKHERSGRPLGQVPFVERLEGDLERHLSPQKRGPKPKIR